jgi:glycosyltransferase involved in cell wall biosynthesis
MGPRGLDGRGPWRSYYSGPTGGTNPAMHPPDEADADVELTLLMPCLDEAETLESCLLKAREGLREHGVAGEILVADNGSRDGSQQIALAHGARVVPVAERGYGAALLGGIGAARGRYVIMADADDSYDWSRIGPFLERLRAGAELVMGCRLPRGGGRIAPGAMPWSHRWLGNPVLSWLGRRLFGTRVTDFHCGMRGFVRSAVERLALRTTGMELATEMIAKAALHGLRIEEVPITLHRDGRSRPPHLRTWRDGWRHLRFMLLYSPSWLFLAPGLGMLLAGALGFAAILPGPRHVAGLTLDVNTLLACSLGILVGFQCLSFALFARVFAMTEGLLPPDPVLTRLFERIGLETGLAAGLLLILGGGALMAGALAYWARQDFGDLSYPIGLRLVIPAVTLLALGIQVVFSSFFLSLLGLRRR